MPKDVYRWEEGGGLVHHCPLCATPLSHEICKTRCLGTHVEWCQKYHTNLFRKDHSNDCAPCGHAENEHHKRHKKIAELLQQLKEAQTEQAPKTPVQALRTAPTSPSPSPLSKKDRKAARKTAKLASMPKVVTTGDIAFVAKVLHPNDSSADEIEEERRLLEDPDIKLNLYFFKGTSNTRESRRRHLKPKVKGEQEAMIDEDELAALLVTLGVPAPGQVKAARERQLVEKVGDAVRDDLVHVAKEHEQTMMRKAGFWRWASRKAYDRLVQNGRLWDDTPGFNDNVSRKDSVVDETEDLAAKGSGEEDSAAEKSLRTLQIGAPKTPTVAERKKGGRGATPSTPIINDGWTQVGKTAVKRTAEMSITSIKLSGNKGLAKLQVKPRGMFGAFSLADEEFVA